MSPDSNPNSNSKPNVDPDDDSVVITPPTSHSKPKRVVIGKLAKRRQELNEEMAKQRQEKGCCWPLR